ncbi:MAG: hypothetical protein ABIE55_04545 [Candidatus Aenigmatarchaeota archaeon]
MAIDLIALQSSEFLIPFLFVMAVVFGVLEITKVFKNRGVNFVIALAISFFAVGNATFVGFLWAQFGNITAFFIVMFFIAFILEMFGLRRPSKESRSESGMLITGAVLFLMLALGFTYSDLIPSLPYIGNGNNLIILFAIVFILAIFWAAFKAGREVLPGKEEHKKV